MLKFEAKIYAKGKMFLVDRVKKKSDVNSFSKTLKIIKLKKLQTKRRYHCFLGLCMCSANGKKFVNGRCR